MERHFVALPDLINRLRILKHEYHETNRKKEELYPVHVDILRLKLKCSILSKNFKASGEIQEFCEYLESKKDLIYQEYVIGEKIKKISEEIVLFLLKFYDIKKEVILFYLKHYLTEYF